MTKFSDIQYVRPDISSLKKQAGGYIRRFKNAKTAEEADAAFCEVVERIENAGTMYVVASIRNTANMKDAFYDAEMKYYNRAMPMLTPLIKKAV